MKSVWKYQVKLGQNIVHMPINSQLVFAHMQDGVPCLWAVVEDTEQKFKVSVNVAVIGTGSTVPDRHEYFSTLMDGAFVWHVFVKMGAHS